MTKEELILVPLPLASRTYKPVAHKQLIDLTYEGLDKSGFTIKKEQCLGNSNGQIMTAYFDLDWTEDPEMGVRVAFQNSYNKKVTVKFAIGGSVFVCENGCIRGDAGAFKRKHTGDVQTFAPSKIQEYLKGVGDNFNKLVLDKERMKLIEMTKKTTAQLIGDLYLNEDLIQETQVAIIKKELEFPTHDYKASGSLWEVYNDVTFSLKGIHASKYIDTHTNLHSYIEANYF